jgi:hypothetical protein
LAAPGLSPPDKAASSCRPSTPSPRRRAQWIHDASYFTNSGVDPPIRITRLRWRANGAGVAAAATYSNATVPLASATVDCLTPSTTFGSNLGPELATVTRPLLVETP